MKSEQLLLLRKLYAVWLQQTHNRARFLLQFEDLMQLRRQHAISAFLEWEMRGLENRQRKGSINQFFFWIRSKIKYNSKFQIL